MESKIGKLIHHAYKIEFTIYMFESTFYMYMCTEQKWIPTGERHVEKVSIKLNDGRCVYPASEYSKTHSIANAPFTKPSNGMSHSNVEFQKG